MRGVCIVRRYCWHSPGEAAHSGLAPMSCEKIEIMFPLGMSPPVRWDAWRPGIYIGKMEVSIRVTVYARRNKHPRACSQCVSRWSH